MQDKIKVLMVCHGNLCRKWKKVVFLRIREECKCKFATSLQQMKNSDKSKRLTIHEILNSKAFFYLFSLVGSIFSNAYSHACITKREKLTFLF